MHSRFLAIWVAVLAAAGLVPAQETRAQLSGVVLDPQGAAVPGAAVTIIHLDTNTKLEFRSNAEGYWEANLLLPGNYLVEVEAPGFKKVVRKGILLSAAARVALEIALELGAQAETVQVTAETPLLDTSAVSSGVTLDNRAIMALPVMINNVTLLARYTPGTQTSGVNSRLGLQSIIGATDVTIAGGVGGNDYTIDGVPNNTSSRRPAQLPFADTVQEMRVETSNFDAAVGHTTGLTIALVTKTGTNELHGTATHMHWQQRWNGSGFFVKQQYYRAIAQAEAAGDFARAAELRAQDIQPSGRSNNSAVTLGGPVVLPKLFDGRNRLFFFFGFNASLDRRSETTSAITYTIPTMAARRGDFSSLLLANASLYQIYDPLTVRPDPARPGHYIRDPLPGNILPPSRIINPMYRFYAERVLPVPNADPLDPRREPLNNFLAVGTPNLFDYYAQNLRLDYQPSGRHRFFVRWLRSTFQQDRTDWTYQTMRGLQTSGLSRRNLGGAADWVWVPAPSSTLDTFFAMNTFVEGDRISTPLQFKPSDVGLPKYMDERAGDRHILPMVNAAGYQPMSQLYPAPSRTTQAIVQSRLSHVRGRHTLQAGFGARDNRRTGGGGGNTSGVFNFGNTYTRRYDDTLAPAGNLGHSWAAFMMGLGSWSVAKNATYATANRSYAAFVQDQWRLRRRLTLNLGLRVEREQGIRERFDRVLGYLDPAVRLPISELAERAYAASPVPELPASQMKVRGGSVYLGAGGAPRAHIAPETMLMPRLSAAFELGATTVLRGGYGLFYDTLNALNYVPNQLGYSRSTFPVLTNDFGVTWLIGNPGAGVAPTTDPFPLRADGTRFDEPFGNALGAMAVAGQNFNYTAYENRRARQQRWRLGIQQQLGANHLLEVAYGGSYSDRVYVSKPMNPLPESYWAVGQVRNDALASRMNANVTNPFALRNFESLRSDPLLWQFLSSQGFFTSPTVRLNQLLRPFPHLGTVSNQDASVGEVRTDALEVSFTRRFAAGFSASLSYTAMDIREADIYLNEFDAAPSWRPSNDGRPHRFVAMSVIELPFGRGRRWLNSAWPRHLLGGWQLSVIYEYQPGPLIDFPNLFFYGRLEEIRAASPSLERWFNTENFERQASRGPASFHRRVFPTRVEGVRADMTNQWNANLQREFRIGERVALQLRLDALNVFNRSQFAAPETNPYSTNFGRITTQTGAINRFLQIQGRIQF
ncbi:MAG: carboxypeptidase-like regulatory domain-containing protein [Bryobacterales bacterium]|nr:carboxypeptidase-like regulatory domain-containing protein [Bryobacterales bacterium]